LPQAKGDQSINPRTESFLLADAAIVDRMGDSDLSEIVFLGRGQSDLTNVISKPFDQRQKRLQKTVLHLSFA
jgi:hypothetical protein